MKNKLIRILLVEDEEIIALQQKRSLENEGYVVLHFHDGESAVEYCKTHATDVDLILMDIDLGEGIDGTETAIQVLKTQEIPIIFVSSHSEKEFVEKTDSIPNYGYVIKGSGSFVIEAAIKMALKLSTAIKEKNQINHKLSATLDALPDLIFEVGLSGTYYDFHTPRNDLLYISPDEILGKNISDVLPKAAAETGMKAILEASTSGSSIGHQIELEVPAGPRWFELSVVRKKDSDGEEPKFIVVSRDITINKLAEKKITRLNHAYTALTHCNQAIVHSKTRQDLFDQICQNLVTNGEMTTAWIGIIDEFTGRIEPKAHSGKGSEWLKEITLTNQLQHPFGLGTIGNSIRNQEGFFCQDMSADPSFSDWREHSKTYQWSSVAGVPLVEGGRVIGVLLVFSSERNAYDDDIKNLLNEMAADIGYALDNFTLNQSKEAAEIFIRTLTDILPSMLGYWTVELKCRFANKAYIDWFGKNPDEIIGVGIEEVLGEVLFQKNESYIKQVLLGIPQTFERTIVKPNGKIGYTLAQYIPDLRNGIVIGFIALVTDISVEKLSEIAQHKAEHLSRATLDALSAHIAILDEESRVIYVNQAWKDFADTNQLHSANYSIGMNYIEICSSTEGPFAEESESFLKSLQDVMDGKLEDFSLEYQCHSPIEKRWFVARITKFKGDGPVRIVVAHENITKRKLAEFGLIENEAKFKTILEHIVDSVIIIDIEGNIRMANESTVNMFGYGLRELTGKNIKILMPTPFREEHDTYLSNYHSTGIKKIIGKGREISALKKNGEVFPIDLSVSEWMFEGEKFFTGIVKDITYKKSMESHLKQSQKLEALGQISGGIAHDFNNILAILMGNLELIARKIPIEDLKVRSKIDASLRAVDRGSQLTKKLLSFARKQAFSPQIFDLNEVIRDNEEMLARVIGKEIEIQVETSAEPLLVSLDKNELQNVILNLAINARDAMDHAGTLTLRTERSNKFFDPENNIPSENEKLFAELTILDTGSGIPEEIKEKIFEPFFTTKAKDKGTGLGLSLTYGFMKQSDGFIKVYSELGKGTCFKLFFPLTEDMLSSNEKKVIEKEDARDNTKNKNFTVLLVDDELPMLKIAAYILTDLGYQIFTAASSLEAMEQLRIHKIDLIITDIIMPGETNGIALAKFVQTNYPQLKIILSSGFPGHLHEKESADLRSFTFIEKPYRIKEFEQKVWEKLYDKI
ncbi:PAS domain S-box protein [Leptospira ognonensis]|uniref:Sensor protein FixL n=1 Tax=Leptospira ognonensis TaxID=2484945 RepID=A0A4R9K2G8_9LEPT|nr:PAS domain S-box protein [Leptospira ognonensis]TGL60199.1 PAS domain S-box protein [Leptospira ognonensis]